MAPILGYWDIRGLAQPIRLLLEHVGAEYEDKLYSCGPAPNFDKSAWMDVKFTLGLDFPNIPYYIDGDLKLTQSGTIIRHLARKYDLFGKTENEKVLADMATEQINDLRGSFTSMCYNPNFNTLKEDFSKTLPDRLNLLNKFLGSKKWFAGDNLTYADFIAYETFDQLKVFDSKCLNNSGNLVRFQAQFEELPKVKKYLASSKCIKTRLNNRIAKFGNGL